VGVAACVQLTLSTGRAGTRSGTSGAAGLARYIAARGVVRGSMSTGPGQPGAGKDGHDAQAASEAGRSELPDEALQSLESVAGLSRC
jgi:hypothetical protein